MSTWTDNEPYPHDFVPPLLADTWRRHQRGEEPVETGPDGFPLYADHPAYPEHALLAAFIDETKDDLYTRVNPGKFTAGRAIMALDDAAKVKLVFAAIERLPWFWKTGVRKTDDEGFGEGWRYEDPLWRWNLKPLLTALLHKPLPFTTEQFGTILEALHEPPDHELLLFIPPKTILRMAKARWQPGTLPKSILASLKKLVRVLKSDHVDSQAEGRKLIGEFSTLLGKPQPPVIAEGEAWGDAAVAELRQMSTETATAWDALLRHCATAASSKPSKKWLIAANRLVDALGRNEFRTRALRWFELVALPRTVRKLFRPDAQYPDPNLLICERNATLLRGLVWCCAGWKDAELSAALSALAEVCFKKVRWHGARCPRVGNACLYSLSVTSSEEAAAQLSRLDSTVKQPTAKARIGKSLDAAASLTGQTREDLEEKSVPDFSLNTDGTLKRALGDHLATIRVVESRDVELRWSRKDGKTFKSAPADVQRDHPEELKQVKRLGKDIEKMLAAQRSRIERLMMTEREWDLESWRQRYLDHGLLAGMTRRLIWHFKLGDRVALGIWLDGKIQDVQGKEMNWLQPNTRVRLWHPIGASLEKVAAWRRWLESHEICQPFKQAHREVYILTDAELQTGTYSNRFAAHVLRQHQFAALCTQRSWKYAMMGNFDFQSTPTLELSNWNMVAEFWVEPAGEMAASGVALHLTTDQVRFVREGAPLPLTEVPALVFTEVMRDVDMFVSVGSIGSDPAWQDHGEIEGAGDYWHNFSFGELTASAKTRREVLEHLLPKLKIADRCCFDERFLIVRGDLRTYKIHLGSGNIRMEPNNQYLCIVPDRGRASARRDQVFLPFEGDITLSVILSEAFLLAEDARIEDPTITSQIRTR